MKERGLKFEKRLRIQDVEQEALLARQNELINNQYNVLESLMDSAIHPIIVLFGSVSLSPYRRAIVRNNSLRNFPIGYEDQKNQQQLFEGNFVESYCPRYAKNGEEDPFFACLSHLAKQTPIDEFFKKYDLSYNYLENLLQRTAAFSNNVECYKNPEVATSRLAHILNVLKKLRIDARDYDRNEELRFVINQRNLINNKNLLDEFLQRENDHFYFIDIPLQLMSLLSLSGLVKICLQRYLVRPYLNPWLFKIFNDELAKKDKPTNKDIFVLKAHTDNLDGTVNLANALKIIFNGFMLGMMIYALNTSDKEDAGILYPALILFIALMRFLQATYQQISKIMENRRYESEKSKLNYAMKETLTDQEISIYKRLDNRNTFFVVPIKRFKRLPAKRVCEVVEKCVKNESSIEITKTFNTSEKENHLKVKIKGSFNEIALNQTIMQSLKELNRNDKVPDKCKQMQEFANIISNAKFTFDDQLHQFIFTFENAMIAWQWQGFFWQQSYLIKVKQIERKDNQLVLQIGLCKDEIEHQNALKLCQQYENMLAEKSAQNQLISHQSMEKPSKEQHEDDTIKQQELECVEVMEEDHPKNNEKIKTKGIPNKHLNKKKYAKYETKQTHKQTFSQTNKKDEELTVVKSTEKYVNPCLARYSLTEDDFVGKDKALNKRFKSKLGDLIIISGIWKHGAIPDCTAKGKKGQEKTFIPDSKIKLDRNDPRAYGKGKIETVNGKERMVYTVKGFGFGQH